jgi:hypothetical protein
VEKNARLGISRILLGTRAMIRSAKHIFDMLFRATSMISEVSPVRIVPLDSTDFHLSVCQYMNSNLA